MDENLMRYWRKFALKILPYLTGRPITLEQVFDGKLVYRRHPLKQRDQLIYINNVEDVIFWARLHTYSFHPYVCAPNQVAKCWYVLDIDPVDNVEFSQVKSLTIHIIKSLQDKLNLDDFVDLSTLRVAFCGKNGFHIFIDFKNNNQQFVFNYSKQISLDLASFLLEYAMNDLNIALKLTSKSEQDKLEEFVQKASLVDRYNQLIALNKFVNFDTRILHHFANIRAPFSIHPETNLVSVPVKIDKISSFNPNLATIDNLLKNY